MSIRKRGKRYWFRFMWKSEWIEKSTGQGNANVARQMEAAYRTALAKGELGIVERQPVPTLKKFAEDSFLTDSVSLRGDYRLGVTSPFVQCSFRIAPGSRTIRTLSG